MPRRSKTTKPCCRRTAHRRCHSKPLTHLGIGGVYGSLTRIQGLRKSVAKVSQRMVAPKTWVGSEGLNVLQVLCDLLELVEQMNKQIAVHVHAPNQPPNNAVLFITASSTAKQQAAMLKLITSLG